MAYFTKKGMRDKVEITYVTPFPEHFIKPKSTAALEYLLKEKNIHIVTDFMIMEVNNENQKHRGLQR